MMRYGMSHHYELRDNGDLYVHSNGSNANTNVFNEVVMMLRAQGKVVKRRKYTVPAYADGVCDGVKFAYTDLKQPEWTPDQWERVAGLVVEAQKDFHEDMEAQA